MAAPNDVASRVVAGDDELGGIAGWSVGAFGDDVLARFATMVGDLEILESTHQLLESAADVVLVAFWRPDFNLATDIQQRIRASGKMLLPVIYDGVSILVGPMIDPHLPPCIGCLALRVQQHTVNDNDTRVLKAILSSPTLGIRGHLPHHATAAAAIAAHAMAAPVGRNAGRASVFTIRTDQLAIREDVLIADPRCAQCRVAAPGHVDEQGQQS